MPKNNYGAKAPFKMKSSPMDMFAPGTLPGGGLLGRAGRRGGRWKGRRAQGNVSRTTKDASQRRRMAMSRFGAGPMAGVGGAVSGAIRGGIGGIRGVWG